MIHKYDVNLLPQLPGIYYLYSKRKKLVYIGKAKDIRRRIKDHIKNYNEALDICNGKTDIVPYNTRFAKPFEYVRYTLVYDDEERHNFELELIEELKPRFNNEIVMVSKLEKMYNKHAWKMLIKLP